MTSKLKSPPPRHAILCVDDEPSILKSLALTLRHKYSVSVANSGAEALELLRDSPDMTVIISDMRMPFMNGAEFLAASRAIAPRARRILLTGDKDPSSAISAVNKGGIYKFLSKPCPTGELHEAVDAAVADYEAEMLEHSAIRRSAEREVLKRDPMTGLESRDSLLERLDRRAHQREAEDVAPQTVMLVEFDNTEELTDGHDSKAGDHALLVLATRLRTRLPKAKCLARYKQNSFVALLDVKEVTESEMEMLANGLVAALEEPVALGSAELQFKVKIGLAQTPRTSGGPRVVLRHAELALREAQQPGRKPVYVYSSEFGEQYERRRETVRGLKLAVDSDQMSLYYQPIVDIEHHAVYSVEALARWEHPQLGRVSPATFIPLAEQTGLMIPLGRWALNRACMDARAMPSDVFPRVSVNVSVMQLLDSAFLDHLTRALAVSGLEASALELEVTESVFADDLEKMCLLLSEVRRLGVSVAIDDFGAGYSSLAYLSRLPVDILKVDAVFIRDFDRGGEAIISAALELAAKLRLEVVIEGVETFEEVAKVKRLGATKIQGYCYAKPMKPEHLDAWYDTFRRSIDRGDK